MASPLSSHSDENGTEASSAWHTARELPDAWMFGQEPSTPPPPQPSATHSSSHSSSSSLPSCDSDEIDEVESYLRERGQLPSSGTDKQAQKETVATQGQSERSSHQQDHEDSEDEQMSTVSDRPEDGQSQAADERSTRSRSEPADAVWQGEMPQYDFLEGFHEQELRIAELRKLRRQARTHRVQEKTEAKAAWTERKAKLEGDLEALYDDYAAGFCSRAEIDDQKAVIKQAKVQRKAEKALELEAWKAKLTEFSEINADETADEIEDELWVNRGGD